jgi:hypothetical protein
MREVQGQGAEMNRYWPVTNSPSACQ